MRGFTVDCFVFGAGATTSRYNSHLPPAVPASCASHQVAAVAGSSLARPVITAGRSIIVLILIPISHLVKFFFLCTYFFVQIYQFKF